MAVLSPVSSQEEAQQELAEEQHQQQEEETVPCVLKVVWCHCVRVEEEGLEQRQSCMVLTDRLLGLFHLPAERHWTHSSGEEQTPSLEEVLAGLQTDLLVPYSDLLLSQCELPDSCLALGVRSSQARWYLFSTPQTLTTTLTQLTSQLDQLKVSSEPQPAPQVPQNRTPQQFLRLLLSAWETEESQGAQGGYPAHLLLASTPTSPSTHLPSQPPDPYPILADLMSQTVSPQPGGEPVSVPCLIFLTQRHLCVLKVDFAALAAIDRSITDSSSSSPSSWSKLIRVPLGSVAVHPRQRAFQGGGRASASPRSQSGHQLRLAHVVQLVVGQRRLSALFLLAQDRLSFLDELTQRRASLDGVKTLVLPSTGPCQHQGQQGETDRRLVQCCCCQKLTKPTHNHSMSLSQDRLAQHGVSLVMPSDALVERLSEENQASPHLSLSLSPGLALLSGLGGEQLLQYFQQNIAQSEGEELRQVLWLSVVLYRSPEAELTSCLLLSTNGIYFLLEDSASLLSRHSAWDMCETGSEDPGIIPCFCLTIKLSDLLSVNVGLFDQYFRVVGRSADQIVCCLSRDSYGTHRFLQQLMSVLSLQDKVPSPEPSDQDFYTQFGNKTTGKMQNYELVHSSRVKFVYPSEEEMGDLTFIVAERKTPVSPASSMCSFNILLYLLVFQVQLPISPSNLGLSHSGSAPSPLLLPRTLILTSTDVFLLEEDYISYPLPEFAKEPPSRDKYQLREARRIRDLDRILMGYQTYPQALTMVFDDLPGPDLLCHLTMDHFTAGEEGGKGVGGGVAGGAEGEVQWCIFVPGADSRERLICLLARQWEALCSRELPVELTG